MKGLMRHAWGGESLGLEAKRRERREEGAAAACASE